MNTIYPLAPSISLRISDGKKTLVNPTDSLEILAAGFMGATLFDHREMMITVDGPYDQVVLRSILEITRKLIGEKRFEDGFEPDQGEIAAPKEIEDRLKGEIDQNIALVTNLQKLAVSTDDGEEEMRIELLRRIRAQETASGGIPIHNTCSVLCEVDMHMHTDRSDGLRSPAWMVFEAYRRGVKAIAITDHNSFDGLREAIAAAKALGIEIIPGIEVMTADYDSRGTEILVYWPDAATFTRWHGSAESERFRNRVREQERSHEGLFTQVWGELNETYPDLKITRQDIEKVVRHRPWLPGAFSDIIWQKFNGDINAIKRAFGPATGKIIDKYDDPYVKIVVPIMAKYSRRDAYMEPTDVTAFAIGHGGTPVLAHPKQFLSKFKKDSMEMERVRSAIAVAETPEQRASVAAETADPEKVALWVYVQALQENGLRGIQVNDWRNDPGDAAFLVGMARKLGLVIISGSDAHGTEDGTQLGNGILSSHNPQGNLVPEFGAYETLAGLRAATSAVWGARVIERPAGDDATAASVLRPRAQRERDISERQGYVQSFLPYFIEMFLSYRGDGILSQEGLNILDEAIALRGTTPTSDLTDRLYELIDYFRRIRTRTGEEVKALFPQRYFRELRVLSCVQEESEISDVAMINIYGCDDNCFFCPINKGRSPRMKRMPYPLAIMLAKSGLKFRLGQFSFEPLYYEDLSGALYHDIAKLFDSYHVIAHATRPRQEEVVHRNIEAINASGEIYQVTVSVQVADAAYAANKFRDDDRRIAKYHAGHVIRLVKVFARHGVMLRFFKQDEVSPDLIDSRRWDEIIKMVKAKTVRVLGRSFKMRETKKHAPRKGQVHYSTWRTYPISSYAVMRMYQSVPARAAFWEKVLKERQVFGKYHTYYVDAYGLFYARLGLPYTRPHGRTERAEQDITREDIARLICQHKVHFEQVYGRVLALYGTIQKDRRISDVLGLIYAIGEVSYSGAEKELARLAGELAGKIWELDMPVWISDAQLLAERGRAPEFSSVPLLDLVNGPDNSIPGVYLRAMPDSAPLCRQALGGSVLRPRAA
ncbi:MAG: PHP domain-containing protein, partial [Candidatus Omnitrophota bacterium]